MNASHSPRGFEFDPDLIRKYDSFGPRYTSYPTADRFHAGFTAAHYVDALAARADETRPLSLYVHLPFCNTVCFYCACNKVITANRGRSARYVRYLRREIDLVSSLLEGERRVSQLHWGGGTPTFLAHGFAATLDKVIDIAPDRIALYGYAHVPHLFKAQRQIDADALPQAETKLAILTTAIDKLARAGYVYIGMDHFAKPGDELAVALRERKLHRNFRGYSTRPDCDLIAFGMSAIGKVGRNYVQNAKTLDTYYTALDQGRVPVFRGHVLGDDDVLRRQHLRAARERASYSRVI